MATMQIRLENGFFTGAEGRYVVSISPTRVDGNGWIAEVQPDGSVQCEAAREYSDGVHSVRYNISREGYAKLTIKTPGKPVQVLRKGYVVPRGSRLEAGVIGLVGGHIDGRYGYFRDASFQVFLNKFGLSSIKREDPNRVYSGFSNHSGWGDARIKVWSDGSQKWDYEDDPRKREEFNSPGGNPNLWSGTETYTVSGAKWVVLETRVDYCDRHNGARILYTQERDLGVLEAMLMANLDIQRDVLKRDQAERLKALDGTRLENLEDVKAIVQKVIEVAPKLVPTLDEERVEEFLAEGIQGTHHEIVVWGPMPNKGGAVEIYLRCTDGEMSFGESPTICSGFLG